MIQTGRFCSPETKKCRKFLAHAGALGMHDTKLNMGKQDFKAKPGPQTENIRRDAATTRLDNKMILYI